MYFKKKKKLQHYLFKIDLRKLNSIKIQITFLYLGNKSTPLCFYTCTHHACIYIYK